jgi:hypothetical protein
MIVSTNQAPPRITSPPYAHSLSPPYMVRGAAPRGDGTAATDAVGFASVVTAAGVGGGVADQEVRFRRLGTSLQSMEPRHRNYCSESRSQRLSRGPAPTHALSFPAGSRIAYGRSASAPCASVTYGQHAKSRNNWAMQTTAGEVAFCSRRLKPPHRAPLLAQGPAGGGRGSRRAGGGAKLLEQADSEHQIEWVEYVVGAGIPVSWPRRCGRCGALASLLRFSPSVFD